MAERSIVVRLRAEIGQYKQQMTDAAKATQQVADQAVKSAKNNREAWNTAGTALTAYGVGVTALGAAVLKTGIAYNTLQQTSRAALTTMLGSAQAAAGQMDKLDDFARNSPFAKQTFITAQQQMLSFGIETQKVLPYLDSVQNAVAAMGGSNQQISEIAFIMAQIQAAAKITGQDLIQFGQRGINAAALIGTQMNMTGAQVRDSITAGSLDAGVALDALAAGMSERFAGSADNVKNTFAGTVDRLKASWREFASELVEPLVGIEGGGVLVDLGNQAADLMNAFRDLPGPVKSTAAALTGVSGLAALTGGGFLLLFPRVMETRRAFQTLAEDMPRTSGALKGVGKAAGAAAAAFVALSAAGAGIEYLQRKVDETLPGLEDLTAQLIGLAKVPAGFSAAGLSSEFDSLADSIDRIANGRWDDGLGEFFNGLPWDTRAASLRQATSEVELLDEALAKLVNQGSADVAAAGLDRLAYTEGLTAAQTENLRGLLTGYNEALKGQANAAALAGDATGVLGAQAAGAAVEVQSLADALGSLLSPMLDQDQAAVEWARSIQGLTEELEGGTSALDRWTKRGQDNRDAIRDRVQALMAMIAADEAAGVGAERLERKMLRGAEAILAAGTAADISKEEMRGYLRELGLTPRQIKTAITNNAAQAAGQAREYNDVLNMTPREIQTYIRVKLTGMASAMSSLGSINPLRSLVPGSADGSTVPRDGGAYSDRFPYLLAPGEEVISNRHGQADRNRPLLKAINAGRLADGGTVGHLPQFGRASGASMSDLFVQALRENTKAQQALTRETRQMTTAQRRFARFERATDRVGEARSDLQDARRNRASRLDILTQQGRVRDLQRGLRAGGDNRLTGLDRRIAQAQLVEARRDLDRMEGSAKAVEQARNRLARAQRALNASFGSGAKEAKRLEQAERELTAAEEARTEALDRQVNLEEAARSIQTGVMAQVQVFSGRSVASVSRGFDRLLADVRDFNQVYASLAAAGASPWLLEQLAAAGEAGDYRSAIRTGRALLADRGKFTQIEAQGQVLAAYGAQRAQLQHQVTTPAMNPLAMTGSAAAVAAPAVGMTVTQHIHQTNDVQLVAGEVIRRLEHAGTF